ncbi:hypothetical protein MKY29_18540 [Psychrobacillus sp. FSL K6-2365]
MFNSPEEVFIFLFSIVAVVSATKLWNSPEDNKKTEQLGKVGQRFE